LTVLLLLLSLFLQVYEYRHVYLPKEMACKIPQNKLLTEVRRPQRNHLPFSYFIYFVYFSLQNEWRALGIKQSKGWEHYAMHRPERHILLFKRVKGYGAPKPVSPPRMAGTRGKGAGAKAPKPRSPLCS
jgi:cyclin-dependent kinase regulatory subunit CKS1